VEPFIESLIHIHELFADGRRPDDLARDSIHFHVYQAERAPREPFWPTTKPLRPALSRAPSKPSSDSPGRMPRDSACGIRCAPGAGLPGPGIPVVLCRSRLDPLSPVAGFSANAFGPRPGCGPCFLRAPRWNPWRERAHLRARDQLTLLYIFHPAILAAGPGKAAGRAIDDLFEHSGKAGNGR